MCWYCRSSSLSWADFARSTGIIPAEITITASDMCIPTIEFHEVLGFWDFYSILGFKVKMHHFEQPASRRVVRKSVECCDFCWISGPQVQLAFQRNWNSRKQSETVGNSRERPGVIVPKLSIRNFFAKKKRSAQSPFFGKCNGKQLETVGARTLKRAI